MKNITYNYRRIIDYLNYIPSMLMFIVGTIVLDFGFICYGIRNIIFSIPAVMLVNLLMVLLIIFIVMKWKSKNVNINLDGIRIICSFESKQIFNLSYRDIKVTYDDVKVRRIYILTNDNQLYWLDYIDTVEEELRDALSKIPINNKYRENLNSLTYTSYKISEVEKNAILYRALLIVSCILVVYPCFEVNRVHPGLFTLIILTLSILLMVFMFQQGAEDFIVKFEECNVTISITQNRVYKELVEYRYNKNPKEIPPYHIVRITIEGAIEEEAKIMTENFRKCVLMPKEDIIELFSRYNDSSPFIQIPFFKSMYYNPNPIKDFLLKNIKGVKVIDSKE